MKYHVLYKMSICQSPLRYKSLYDKLCILNLHVSYITKFDFMNNILANLVLACFYSIFFWAEHSRGALGLLSTTNNVLIGTRNYQTFVSQNMMSSFLLFLYDFGLFSSRLFISDICSIPSYSTWVKVFRINPEFRILRLTFQRKSASKCLIKEIIIASLISFHII